MNGWMNEGREDGMKCLELCLACARQYINKGGRESPSVKCGRIPMGGANIKGNNFPDLSSQMKFIVLLEFEILFF